MPDFVITTDSVAGREREALWHHLLADNLGPVHVDGFSAAPEPSASLGVTQRGRLSFVELESTAQSHHRTAGLIRGAEAAFFQVVVHTEGVGVLDQDDRQTELAAGDLLVYQNSQPFSWTFPDRWGAVLLSIPADAIRLTDAQRRDVSGQRLSGSSGLSGVVSRFVLDLARHASEIPVAHSEQVLAQCTDLLVSLLTDPGSPGHADAVAGSLLHRAKDYMRQHLRNPLLSPAEIAAAMNVSVRYLHKLFEGEHDTVFRHLKGLRLHRARQELLDPRSSSLSIASIAHHCGFGDLSGFNRAFKAAYGLTPGELRRQSRAPERSERPFDDLGS